MSEAISFFIENKKWANPSMFFELSLKTQKKSWPKCNPRGPLIFISSSEWIMLVASLHVKYAEIQVFQCSTC